MDSALHHTGPITVTIRMAESDDGWRFGLDTREGNGCGIGSPVSASRSHLTRASAIDAAVRWIRRFHGADINPALGAWLDGLSPAQADLFRAAA